MWQIKQISADNFMSFEKVEFSFENNCYIVRAQNLDNDGQLSNGGGKTSFIDIIAIALLGYSLTGRNVKDCVNWSNDASFFEVALYMENKEHNLNCFIQRKIYSKSKGQELILLVNDEIPKTLPSKAGVDSAVEVKAGDEYILKELLGINQDDLLNYFLISSKYYTPFLKVNTDKKLEVISRFSKAEVVDKAIKKIELEQEVNEDSVEEYKLQISKIEGHIEALQQSLTGEAAKQFEVEKEKKIESLVLSQKDIEYEILGFDQQIEALKKQNEAVEFEEVDTDEGVYQSASLNSANKRLEEYSSKLNEGIKLADQIEIALAGMIKCPKCEHEFIPNRDTQYTIDDFDNQVKIIEDIRFEIERINDEIEFCLGVIDKICETEGRNEDKNKEIALRNKEIQSLKKRTEGLLDDYDRYTAQIETESAKTFADEKAVVKDKIKEKKAEIKEQEKQLKETLEELEHNKQWIANFDDFKFYLGNKPIEIICSLVNQYLKLNNSDLNLYIEGFKRLKSGELRQALQPVIYRNWMNPKSYEQFSEGEKVRLNLAVDLAFQQLINSSSKYGGLNLYINDELISGLDSKGVQNAAQAFDELGKTILLVTHSGADLNYSNTINIQKKGNKSTVL